VYTDEAWRKAHEIQSSEAKLHTGDYPWLGDLAAPWITIDDDWLEGANPLVITGSINLHDNPFVPRNEVTDARYQFFGKLGWSDPACELAHVLQIRANLQPQLILLSTFIGTQRLFHERGLQSSRLLKNCVALAWRSRTAIGKNLDILAMYTDDPEFPYKYTRALSSGDGTLDAIIDDIKAAGKDPRREIAKHGTILTSHARKRELLTERGQVPQAPRKAPSSRRIDIEQAPKTDRRLANASQLGHLVGWSGDMAKVGEQSRLFTTMPNGKLNFHARLFAQLATEEMIGSGVDEGEVAALIDLPPNAHLGALILGKAYTAENVASVRETLALGNPFTDVKKVKDTLADPARLEAAVGAKVVRAYDRFLHPAQKRH
jgi:hypothetical protein